MIQSTRAKHGFQGTVLSSITSADEMASEVREAVTEIVLTTDRYTGRRYLQHLTETIARYFGMDGAFVCELGMDWDKAYAVASYAGEGVSERIDCFERGGAADALIDRGDLVHTDSVQGHFPADKQLKALGAEAFIGTVLRTESLDPIGVLFLVHKERVADAALAGAVLHQLAPRVGCEIERSQHELAYRRSEARLRFLTDRSKDVLFYYQLSPTVELQYVSPAVESVFGLPPEALHANPSLILDMVVANERAEAQRMLSSGSEEPIIVQLQLPNGATRWVEYRDFAVRDNEERLTGIGGNIRDVTPRMEAEEALREGERHQRMLLESVPDTLLLLSAEGHVMDYVPGEVQASLTSLEEMKGRSFKTFILPAILGVLERTIRATTHSRHIQRTEFEVPGNPPSVYDARCLPVGDGALLLVLRNLTTRKSQDEQGGRPYLREVIIDRTEHHETRANPYGLTPREIAVLHLVVEGMADKQIADSLGISTYTVNKHVGNILGKLNAVSRTEAGVRAIKEGLLTPELQEVEAGQQPERRRAA